MLIVRDLRSVRRGKEFKICYFCLLILLINPDLFNMYDNACTTPFILCGRHCDFIPGYGASPFSKVC